CSHHRSAKATELLSDEHRVIERVLAVLEKLASRPVKGSFDSWKKAIEFIRHFADGCHHFKEEKVLFPALEGHGIPRDGGPVGMMLIEHEEGRSYVRGMADALAQVEEGDPSAANALFENAKQYVRLLREHIQKEDEVLFPMAENVIPVDEQKTLLSCFAEHEAQELGAGTHERYLKIASELASLTDD
ncbi:MAG: hemerythrin, partial [Deltaproteobacteria bacterium]|nr:hemerythrin [Deltaproteobacteria bacterium]